MSRRGRCCRCRRTGLKLEGSFPDGPLCTSCYGTAIRTIGTCASCNQNRLVPGLSPDGRLCVRCAGITTRSFSCSRCDREFALRRGICEYCFLADRLDEILTGPVDLSSLREVLLRVDRPDSLIMWLRGEHTLPLLKSLAAGTTALTHAALDETPSRKTADHLRAILIEASLLPRRDPVLARYDRWIQERLDDTCTHVEDLQTLRLFVTWHQRRRLVANRPPLRPAQINNATQCLRVSGQFLDWLRESNTNLSTCTQHQIDDWLTTPPTTRTAARQFLVWAKNTGRMPPHTIGHRKPKHTPQLSQDQRLDAISKCLQPRAGEPWARCAALLVLLFAQPIHKIIALTTVALTTTNGELHLKLGTGSTPIPAPFATVFRELLENQRNTNLYNRDSTYLFPGQRPRSHIDANTARLAITAIIGDILPARNAALRQLVIDCPPPVIAAMLDYSDQVTTKHAAAAGSPWMTYTATRSATTRRHDDTT